MARLGLILGLRLRLVRFSLVISYLATSKEVGILTVLTHGCEFFSGHSHIPIATKIPVRFVCLYTSSTLPFIAVSNSFTSCFDHCLNLFQSITRHWS